LAKQPETLSSVHNAMRILKEFTHEQPELGISELSVRLGLAKSTVFRLIKTLSENHLVEQNSRTQKYHLGIGAFELGFTVYHEMELRLIALPLLDKLMRTVRKAVHLGVYDQGGVVYLCKRIPEDHQGTISRIGRRVPAHCTASGKILLAHQDEKEINRFLSGELKPYTNKTITSKEKLMEQLDEVRKKGYVVCNEELKEGITSIAIPVYNDLNEVIAAISVTGSTPHFYSSQIQNHINEMRMFSRLITERMDFDN
jgi:IclR family KDG regulon transcriptional repressor